MDNYNSNSGNSNKDNDIYSYAGDSWDISRFLPSDASASRERESEARLRASNRSTARRSTGVRAASGGSDRRNTSKSKRWPLGLLFFYILSIFWMEMIFRISIVSQYSKIFSAELLYVFFFSVIGGVFCYVVTTFLKKKANLVAASVVTAIIGVIFAFQTVYYGMFQTPFILDLMSEAGSAAQFAGNMIKPILKYLFPLLLIFVVPQLVLFTFGKKKFVFLRTNIRFKGVMAGSGVLLYLVLVITMLASGAKELYFKTGIVNDHIGSFGVVQTATLDLFRTVFGVNVSGGASSTDKEGTYSNNTSSGDKTVTYDTSPNVMDIDFNSLIANESDETIKAMHEYFSSVEPTNKNAYTGMFKGYNLIYITAEALSPYAVDEKLTPTLYKLVHEGWEFTNYYSPLLGISTTDGEWGNCTGLFPTGYLKANGNKMLAFKYTGTVKTYLPFCFGNQFNKLNYQHVWAYHNHTSTYYSRNLSHPNMGYDYQGYGSGDHGGLAVTYSWPESDLEMMQLTLPQACQNDNFHLYYMTVSGHMNYSFTGNRMSSKHKAEVQAMYPNMCEEGQAYLACNMELDKALEYTLNYLETAGKLDKTIIAMSCDHYPYGLSAETMNELSGHTVDTSFEMYENNLVIYNSKLEHKVFDRPIYHLDLLPTLSNLFGLEYDSRLLAGRDIFSDCIPLVVFQNGSWLTDRVKYNAKTKETTSLDGSAVDEEYVAYCKKLASNRKKYSKLIIENDYYRAVFGSSGV